MAKANNIIAFVIFLIIICTVLAVCLLNKSNVDIKKISRHYPNKMLIYDDYSFKDERFVYLVCDKENFSKCKIVQEKYPYKTIFKSCDVSLGVEKVNRTNENFIFVVAFGENKAVLIWGDDHGKHDKPYVNISVVNLKECKQEETKSYGVFTTKQLNNVKKIITNDETFDVFFKNPDICSPSKECRLRFKSDGNTDSKDEFMVNQNFNVTNIYSIGRNSSDKRYAYLKSHDGKPGLFLIRSDGSEISLSSLPGDFKISVVNESIGVCSKLGFNTMCYQYDSEGQLKLNVTLKDVHNNTELKDIYTLPEKAFLLSFAEFGRCEEDVCDPEILTTYFIQKVDNTSKSIVKLRFQGIDKDYKVIKHSYIWKAKKDEEYCAFIEPFRESDRIEFFTNCFPISNFDL